MLSQHRTHLASTYHTVLQHLAEIREVATTGKTPGGGKVTPLRDPLRGDLLAALSEASAGLEEVVRCFAPDQDPALAQRGGLLSTRMWISILLRTAEELVRDVRPVRMTPRYGQLGEDEAALLEEKLERPLLAIRRALAALDSLTAQAGGGLPLDTPGDGQ